MSLFFVTLILTLNVCFASPMQTVIRSEGVFSYDQNSGIGPMDWGTIEGFETCGSGMSQSPIDLPVKATLKRKDGGPVPHFSETTLKFGRTTENFELECEEVGKCGFTTFQGKRFNLVNVHWHSPAEHRVGGVQFPLEMHMVHKTENGEAAVISTLFRLSKGNEVLEEVFSQVEDGEEVISIDLEDLLGDKGYVQYSGSLTTPPCTEGVTWFIARKIQRISADQVARYGDIAEITEFGNNRPTQPLNARKVTAFIGEKGGDDGDCDFDFGDDA